MIRLVAVDLGGTHVRFALAEVSDGRVTSLGDATTLRTADHASFRLAWEAFATTIGEQLPGAAALAIAAPLVGDTVKLTNNPWVLQPSRLGADLGLDALVVINDFGAVAHAVVHADPQDLSDICGPSGLLPSEGLISVVGPGTGFGVAHVIRSGDSYVVTETEGGHIDFAPLDTIDDAILAHLRSRHRRVSIERVVSGPGLVAIHDVLAEIEGQPLMRTDDQALWTRALDGTDGLASAALDRFCLSLGAVAGDIALAQGAKAVVIAGGLGLRLAQILPHSGFRQRFAAKGRFEQLMSTIPVKLITHRQPGLLGAAAAFAHKYG